jgi:uncharacterized protein (TIGR03437 family)
LNCRAQYTCPAPGLGSTPIVTGWNGSDATVLLQQTDKSWSAIQYSLSPFSVVSVTRDFFNLVVPCALPGLGRQGSGAIVGAVPPAVTAQLVAGGDLDGSGNLSGVIIRRHLGLVDVYLGNPGLSEKSKTSYQIGALPSSIVLAPLTHSGKPDMVMTAPQSGSGTNGFVAVLLNNGNGTFQAPAQYTTGSYPTSVAVGDVNGDGIPDLVAANSNDTPGGDSVSVFIGRGDGTFKPAVNYPAGSLPQGLILADFNGDGNLDIAVGNDLAGTITVLLNLGHGTFGSPITSPCTPLPWYLAAWDFDGDGKLDLAVNSGFNSMISILHGNGDGTFTLKQSYATDLDPASLVVADFNNDGIADIAVASGNPAASQMIGPDFGNNNMTILFGNGDGTFRATELVAAGSDVQTVAVADVNGDGIPDLVVTGNNAVTVIEGAGDRNFGTPQTVPIANVNASFTAVADINGDGNADLVVADAIDSLVAVVPGNGKGGFGPPTTIPVTGAPMQLAVGDFNGDGLPDIAVAGGSNFSVTPNTTGAVSILVNQTSGGFRTPTTPLTGINATMVATGDFNLDGNLDLAVVNGGSFPGGPAASVAGSVIVLTGNGDGTFAAMPALTIGTQAQAPTYPLWVSVGDVNGDGKPDLVVLYQTNLEFQVQLLLGNGDGTFRALAPMNTEFGATSLEISDFSGDGYPDLVIAHCCGETDMTYMLGNGDGSFQAEVDFTAGPSPEGLALGEITGDGIQDLVVADNAQPAYVAILPGLGLRTQSAASFAFQPLAPGSIAASFGNDLATGTAVSTTVPPPITLHGTFVTIKDSAGTSHNAPLLYVAPYQVNWLIPNSTAAGPATITVRSADGTETSTLFQIASAVSPGVFTLNSDGLIAATAIAVQPNNSPTIENVYQMSNGKVVAHPINLGVAQGDRVTLQILGTGIQAAGIGGTSVTIGGVAATVQSVGPSGNPGEDQVNVRIPSSLAGRGKVSVVLTANGKVANVTNFVVQ